MHSLYWLIVLLQHFFIWFISRFILMRSYQQTCVLISLITTCCTYMGLKHFGYNILTIIEGVSSDVKWTFRNITSNCKWTNVLKMKTKQTKKIIGKLLIMWWYRKITHLLVVTLTVPRSTCLWLLARSVSFVTL